MHNHSLSRLQSLVQSTECLTVYHQLLRDGGVARMRTLLERCTEPSGVVDVAAAYHRLVAWLLNHQPSVYLGGTSCWQCHILGMVLDDDNAFTRKAALGGSKQVPPHLVEAVQRDLTILQSLFRLEATDVREASSRALFDEDWEGPHPSWWTLWDFPSSPVHTEPWDGGRRQEMARHLATAADWATCWQELAQYHHANGSGPMARYYAFQWERHGNRGLLRGVSNPDPVTLADLVGYQAEREQVITNTMHLLHGYQANNILLYGDRGTGKSSTVKAVAKELAPLGLRLIEVPKHHLRDFPFLVRILRHRPQKFILFVDDLSFDEGETDYKHLKALLEGGLEARPANVVIYATSNRRHLIKEDFADRQGMDEVRRGDTLQEKLSLSDRFGITVIFPAPDQEGYLKIVEGILSARGLSIPPAELRQRALQWSLWHNGRSGRTARQFVDHLTAELGGRSK